MDNVKNDPLNLTSEILQNLRILVNRGLRYLRTELGRIIKTKRRKTNGLGQTVVGRKLSPCLEMMF